MASLTAAASVSVPCSFSGLRANTEMYSKTVPLLPTPARPSLYIRASAFSEMAGKVSSAALIATTAALSLVATPAMAAKVEVGDEVGSFKFSPESVTVSAGEAVEFTLVGETGHNVVFDIPAGAPASVVSELSASSMGENDLLSEDEPTFTAKISTPGTYTFYCTPHKSANMKGTITVK